MKVRENLTGGRKEIIEKNLRKKVLHLKVNCKRNKCLNIF